MLAWQADAKSNLTSYINRYKRFLAKIATKIKLQLIEIIFIYI